MIYFVAYQGYKFAITLTLLCQQKNFFHHAPCKTFVYRGEIILFSVKVFLVTMTEHLIYESRKKFVKAKIYSNFIGQYISVLDKNHNISLENKISRLAHVMSQHTISLQECSHFFLLTFIVSLNIVHQFRVRYFMF